MTGAAGKIRHTQAKRFLYADASPAGRSFQKTAQHILLLDEENVQRGFSPAFDGERGLAGRRPQGVKG